LEQERPNKALRKASSIFGAPCEVDPHYALAYAGLADSYIHPGVSRSVARKRSDASGEGGAKRLWRSDDTTGEAHISLAYVTAAYEWDWFCAEREYKLALALNANYGDGSPLVREYLRSWTI